jgi:cullin-associated NEDD8-dissociated protein 1
VRNPLLNRIVDKGTELLKYDPNFAGDDDDGDEDEEMAEIKAGETVL